MLSRGKAQAAKWIVALVAIAAQLFSAVQADPMGDFQGASGLDSAQLSAFITGLTQAVLGVGLCWILVSVIRGWLDREKREAALVWVVFRCFILAVGVGGMLVLF